MKKIVLLTMMSALLLVVFSGYVWADKKESITAFAEVVPINPNMKLSIIKCTDNGCEWGNPQPPSSGMNFGKLVPMADIIKPANKSEVSPPHTALAEKHYFLVQVGVTNNTGKPYAIKYFGAPLLKKDDPKIKLSGDAWTVEVPGENLVKPPKDKTPPIIISPANGKLAKGIHSAEETFVVYNSNSKGDSATISMYFRITGDPEKAAGPKLIPVTQPAGQYSGTVTLNVYPL